MKKQITAIAAGKWLLDVGCDLLSQLSVEEGPSRHLTLKSRVFHLSAKSADIGPFLDRYQLKTRPKRSLLLSFCPKKKNSQETLSFVFQVFLCPTIWIKICCRAV